MHFIDSAFIRANMVETKNFHMLLVYIEYRNTSVTMMCYFSYMFSSDASLLFCHFQISLDLLISAPSKEGPTFIHFCVYQLFQFTEDGSSI